MHSSPPLNPKQFTSLGPSNDFEIIIEDAQLIRMGMGGLGRLGNGS
jgi:hypothetical protein